jgi:5-methylcytosine-specific restriction endonuclease McrA
MRVFIRDGFTDRYSGTPLVFPGTLRAVSLLLPKEFPYQRNWRQSETHPAFWELYPTIDHIVPLARGGTDIEENVVTTSMLRNAAKANWLLEELGWPTSTAPVRENWDGLLSWFMLAYDRFEVIRDHPSTRTWYRAARNATQ